MKGFVPPPPPPPPPPGKGALKAAPIPPPPPNGPQSPNRKPNPAAALRWRQLHWEVIPVMRIRGTVFERLRDTPDDEAGIDHDSLKGLFSQSNARTAAAKTAAGGGDDNGPTADVTKPTGPGKRAPVITLLDLKRGSNIEIMLSKMNPDVEAIARAVQSMDAAALDAESVAGMIRFLPTADECVLVNAYEGDERALGKAERYFRALTAVPGFESKLRALEFKQGFASAIGAVRDWTECVDRCATELKQSSRMGRLIALVLNLGNALNAARGPAHGFALSSLPKLLDTRSFDGKTTLLHYLVAHLENTPKDLDLLQFTADLPSLERASRLTFAQIEEELAPLHAGLRALSEEVEAATKRVTCESVVVEAFPAAAADAEDAKDAAAERAFREALVSFHADAAARLAERVAALDDAKASFREAARYYGEDASKIKIGREPERFAKVVADFGALVATARRDRGKVKAAASASPKEKENADDAGTERPPKKKLSFAGGDGGGSSPEGGSDGGSPTLPRIKIGKKRDDDDDDEGRRRFTVVDMLKDIKEGGDRVGGLRKIGSPSKRQKKPFWKKEADERVAAAKTSALGKEAPPTPTPAGGGGAGPPPPPPPPGGKMLGNPPPPPPRLG